jgi:hypothetical protein
MHSFSKATLILGILMTIGGVAGTGLTYRDMKTQNILHARTGIIQLNLGKQSEWDKETFAFYQPGDHVLYLTTVDAFSKPHGTELKRDVSYNGTIEVIINTPSGGEYLHQHITSDSTHLIKPNNLERMVLDTLHISEPFSGIWSISSRVVKPDTNFSKTLSEIFVMPPQKYDIGWYLYNQTFKLVGWGLLMLVGFGIIVLGGYLRRHSAREERQGPNH